MRYLIDLQKLLMRVILLLRMCCWRFTFSSWTSSWPICSSPCSGMSGLDVCSSIRLLSDWLLANDLNKCMKMHRISGILNDTSLPENTIPVRRCFLRSASSTISIGWFAWLFSAFGRRAERVKILRKKCLVSPREGSPFVLQQLSCPSSHSEMIALGREQVDEWGAFEGSSTYEYAHTHAKESRVNATA